MKKIEIIITLGPTSINKKFFNYINKNKVSLVRLNMSHVKLSKLEKKLAYIKKYCEIPICIDTEGAQIRTVLNGQKSKKIKKGNIIYIHKNNKKLNFYPDEVFDLLKKNDVLDVGFEGLQLKITKLNKYSIVLKCTNPGIIENNKGVHLKNRKINLKFVTKKDLEAIKIAKKYDIKNFALSFTNSNSDLIKFCKLLPNEKKFFKIETM